MFYTLEQTLLPASEPVTVEDAKVQARIDADVTDEDGLLRAYIRAATRQVETETGRQLMLATYVYRASGFPSCAWIEIPKPPLIAVTSVAYVDTAGVTQTWASSNYRVDVQSDPGRVHLAYGISWPSVRSQYDAVQITYLAGYGAELLDDDPLTYGPRPEAVPEALRIAILLWVADLYRTREPSGEKAMHVMPYSIERFLWPYRLASVLVG